MVTQEQDREIVEMQINSEDPSSSKATKETDSNIQNKYKQIREINEEIKNEVYSQLLKENPGNKDRLLTTFDYSTNNMIMSFLKPTITDPKSIAYHTKIEVEVINNTIHELDQL